MSYPLRFLILSAVAGVICFVRSPAIEAAPQRDTRIERAGEAPITTLNQYWDTSNMGRLRPIDLEVVVAYYDPAWGNFWGLVQGRIGYLHVPPGLPIRSFDRVRIHGLCFARETLDPDLCSFEILERGVDLPAETITGPIARPEQYRERMVTITGIVDREHIPDPDHIAIELISDGYRVHAYMWQEDPTLLGLASGDIVTVTGVYNGATDAIAGTLEVDVWIGRASSIRKVGDLSNDPRFDSEPEPIERLHHLFNERRPRAHIVGYVRDYVPDVGITVRDATGQVVVASLQNTHLQIGDVMEAVGRPFTGSADWMLQEAVVRPASPRAAAKLRAQQGRTVLRLADQIMQLKAGEAAEGRFVDITGIVSWGHADADYFYLRDPSAGIRVILPEDVNPLAKKPKSGNRVIGYTRQGAFAPEVVATRIEPWGTALLPVAKPVTLEEALSGRMEAMRVEMRGHVTAVTVDGPWRRIHLGTDTGSFTAVVAASEVVPPIDNAIITLHGVCRGVADARRQLIGIELEVAYGENIRVDQAAPVDPFALPTTGIADLRLFNAAATLSHWAKVSGVVTHSVPGRYVVIQDGGHGLTVWTRQTDPLRSGDVIEAAGLPTVDRRRVELREGVYRTIGHAEEPVAVALDADRLKPDAELDGRLVSVTAELASVVEGAPELTLVLHTGDAFFDAQVANATMLEDRAAYLPGSRLTVTGVYQVVRDERRESRGFRLHLRGDGDIRVLRRPSWWTPARAFGVTLSLIGVLAAGFMWLMALRRRVDRQTSQIREQITKEANLESRHRQIFENASDLIFTTDRNGRFVSFNPAGTAITGYAHDEALSLGVDDILTGDAQHPSLMDLLRRTPDRAVTLQGHLRRKGGERIWAETSARLIVQDGEVTGMLGVVRDISQRKRFEEELKCARDAAQAATHAKSVFLANMSHEVRTPMNGVIGMSHLLLDTPLRSDQREYAHTIRDSAESLLTVLNDILDFSKIEAGRLTLEAGDFELTEMVQAVTELMEVRARAKNLPVCTTIAADAPRRLRGDSGRMRQVLLNLVGNAVKFTEQGEVRVAVTCPSRTPEAVLLRFEVSDSGIGIPAEIRAKLFQPFEQADASTARRFGGTGLGLAISRQLVEMMGGEIGVDSEEGRGSTFWFTVRLTEAAQAPTNDPAANVTRPSPAVAERPLRVLIAEDNAVNQRLTMLQLKKLGCVSDVAANGLEVLDALERQSYDIVLMDCQMPEMDGFEATRRIRADTRFAGQRVVAMTANAMQGDRQRCLDAGMDDYLSKPTRPEELRKVLDEAAARSVALAGASSAG